MKTIEINLYKFDELTEEAKNNAIIKYYDINTDYDWYDYIIEHAKTNGIDLYEFDTYSGNCKCRFTKYLNHCIDSIKSNCGKDTELYKLADNYEYEYNNLVSTYSDGINTNEVAEGNAYEFDKEADELEKMFLNDVAEEYLLMLRKEEEYLYSEEAIKETLIANGYDFTEDGNIY